MPAGTAAAAAVLLRRGAIRSPNSRPVVDQVAAVLEAAQVTPQAPKATLLRRAGAPDAVLIPVELAAELAEVLTAGLEDLHRVDKVRGPADLVALRDRLRRAPLVADLTGGAAARGTPDGPGAHDADMDALTPDQLADRRGVTPNRIRQLCRAGRIEGARKHGRDWIIPATSTITAPRGA